MGLRIVGGEWGGRLIEAPAGQATRPLLERIRQSLFDALGQDLTGLTVVDCCAGSGAFGLEALSRGAASAILIEADQTTAHLIAGNAQRLGAGSRAQVRSCPWEAVLPLAQPVDLVFCDPPFPWFATAPERIASLVRKAAASLAPGGRMLLRGETGQQAPQDPPGVSRLGRDRIYGRSWVRWWQRDDTL